MAKGLIPDDNDVLLTFLEKTKKGEYAVVEQTSLAYARMKEQDESQNIQEQQYSYCLS